MRFGTFFLEIKRKKCGERVVRGGLPEKVTLEQRLGGSERGHTVPILRGEHSRQRDQQLLPRP